jgi:hypothetical protein
MIPYPKQEVKAGTNEFMEVAVKDIQIEIKKLHKIYWLLYPVLALQLIMFIKDMVG